MEIKEFVFGILGNKFLPIDYKRGRDGNELYIFSDGRKSAIVKRFSDPNKIERELFASRIFGEHLRVPEIFGRSGNLICMEWIKSGNTKSIDQAIIDWDRIHNIFANRCPVYDPLVPLPNPDTAIDLIESDRNLIWLRNKGVMDALVRKPLKIRLSMVHGDLWGKNILNDGENCYIDFEYSGSGNPLSDIATLALSFPRHHRHIVDKYCTFHSYDPHLKADLQREILARAVHSAADYYQQEISGQKRELNMSRLAEMIKEAI